MGTAHSNLVLFARNAAGILASAIVYYLLARFGMAVLSLQPENITLLWLPSGVALLMSVRWRYRAFPWIVLASFAANLPDMLTRPGPWPYVFAGVVALSDGFAGVLAAFLLRKRLPNGLVHVHDLLPFGLWVCLGTTTVTGLILSADLAVGGYIPWHTLPSFLLQLLLGDSLGILLVFPVYQGWRDGARFTRQDLLWLSGSGTAILILLALGFSILPGAVFFVVPVLLILSFNVGLFGVSIMSALTMIGVIGATAHNVGVFAAADAYDSHLRMLAFVFSSALTILGMALQNRQLVETEHSRKLWHEAAHRDHLTGLINRRGFLPLLRDMHQRALRQGQMYALAILDLDHFKQINDTYGHQAGDQVLCKLASVLAQICRPVDSIARLGGEEFAILFPDYTAADAAAVLDAARRQFESKPVEAETQVIPVTVSAGVASFVHVHEDDSHVVARADKALYAAKARGRNRVIVDEAAVG